MHDPIYTLFSQGKEEILFQIEPFQSIVKTRLKSALNNLGLLDGNLFEI